MSTGCVVVFDDDSGMVQTLSSQNETKQTGLEFKGYSKREDYEAALRDDGIRKSVRVLVVDLAANKDEEASGKFRIKEALKNSYNDLRIPIFIHSGHLDRFEDFPRAGTVFKVGKSADSAAVVFDKIKLMQDSGFLEIFCPMGKIETKIMRELHKAFTNQFHDDEIFEIIKTLNREPSKTYVDRVESIFERISLRSLLQSLIFSPQNGADQTDVNPVEHYYRRISISTFPVWTGDLFEKKDKSQRVYVLTPRCDVASKGRNAVLVCKVIQKDMPTAKDKVEKAVRNNPMFSGNKYRYLPPTPLFVGGNVDLSDIFLVESKDLSENYSYLVSLSDELANEISGKFGAYFLRTGITEINLEEQMAFIKSLG